MADAPRVPTDPIASAARGVTEGALHFTKDEVKGLVSKFKRRKLAFLEQPATIEEALKSRKSSEFAFYKTYVKDGRARLLIQVGLALRRHEAAEDTDSQKRLQSLRETILRKHESAGLHLAQAVQNHALLYLINEIIQTSEEGDVRERVADMIADIDNRIIFVQAFETPDSKAKKITIRVHAHNPPLFMVAGARSAVPKVKKIEKLLEFDDYEKEVIERVHHRILVFRRSRP